MEKYGIKETANTNLEKIISIVEKIYSRKEVFDNRENIKTVIDIYDNGIFGGHTIEKIDYDKKGRTRRVIRDGKLKKVVKIDDKKQKAIAFYYNNKDGSVQKKIETEPNRLVNDFGLDILSLLKFKNHLFDILMDIKMNGDLSDYSIDEDGTVIEYKTYGPTHGTIQYNIAESNSVTTINITEFDFDGNLIKTTAVKYIDGELYEVMSTQKDMNFKKLENKNKRMVYYLRNDKPFVTVHYDWFNGNKRPLKITMNYSIVSRRTGRFDTMSIYKYYDKE